MKWTDDDNRFYSNGNSTNFPSAVKVSQATTNTNGTEIGHAYRVRSRAAEEVLDQSATKGAGMGGPGERDTI